VIGVLDYGIGNLRSAEKALEHLGAEAALLSDPDEADAAEALVRPLCGGPPPQRPRCAGPAGDRSRAPVPRDLRRLPAPL